MKLSFLIFCLILVQVGETAAGVKACAPLVHFASQYQENPARVLARGLEKSFGTVRVDRRRIKAIAKTLLELQVPLTNPGWNWPPYRAGSSDFEDLFAFFLTINSINYKYFHTGSEREFSHAGMNEAVLMATRVDAKWEELKAQSFRRLRQADEKFLANELFQADTPMPMLRSRVQAFRELGEFLNENHDPANHVWLNTAQAIRNPAALAFATPAVLPTWRDPFLKRAQLNTFMLIGRAESLGIEAFDPSTYGSLTVAADYMVPRILESFGAIVILDPSIRSKIERRELIVSGSRFEYEWRAATILAIDEMAKEMNRLQNTTAVTAIPLDAIHWLVATRNYPDPVMLEKILTSLSKNELLPYHQTETTDY